MRRVHNPDRFVSPGKGERKRPVHLPKGSLPIVEDFNSPVEVPVTEQDRVWVLPSL